MRMTTSASPVRLQQLSAWQLWLLSWFNIPRSLSQCIRLLEISYFLTCENGRKEKKSMENGRGEQVLCRVESNKAPSLVYVKNLNLTITMKTPQLLKIFLILNMVPQFSQNITAVWVSLIIYSQAKTKHCLKVFWLKSIGFSQIWPQKRQSTETPVCLRY